MKAVGFINPNIFAARNLEYKIRFNKAPFLSQTVKALEKENIFNSYLVRGEYDVVLVGLESASFLFRAATEKKIEDLKLRETATCTVDQFLKYHGCLVPAMKIDQIPQSQLPEICQQLFYLSKDWNTDFVSEDVKKHLQKANLLMESHDGEPYGAAVPNGKAPMQRTIVRLGFYGGVVAQESLARFQKFLKDEMVKNPEVRNCYLLKLPAPFAAMMEVISSPEATDRFLVSLHEKCDAKFPDLAVFIRSEVVMKKISDGQMNILVSMQTKPELIEHVREKLLAPILNMDEAKQGELIRFIDKAEETIRQIRQQPLREKFMEVLAEFQIAFYLNRYSILEDAIKLFDHELLGLMIRQFAAAYKCPPTNEDVADRLKKKGDFQDHLATLGNLYPVFLKTFKTKKADLERDQDLFRKFNEFYTQTVYAARSRSEDVISADTRAKVEDFFCGLADSLPHYFSGNGKEK